MVPEASPSPKPVERVRRLLLRIALVACLLYLPILGMVHGVAWWRGDLDGWMAVRAVLHLLLIGVLAAPVPARTGGAALVGYLVYIAAQAVLTYGFAPNLGLIVMAVVFSGYLFFGWRGLGVSAALGLGAVALAGGALIAGWVAPPVSETADPTSLYAWVRIGSGYALLVCGVGAALGYALWTSEQEAERARAALARELAARDEREAARRAAQEARQALERAERLETVGQVAAGAAHDLGNALAVVQGSAEVLLDEVRPDLRPLVDDVLAGSRGAATTARYLLTLARRDVAEPSLLLLVDEVPRIVRGLRRVMPEGLHVEADVSPGLHCWMDPVHLERVVVNLAINARDAMPDGGRVRLMAEPGEGGGSVLRVIDEGVGMDEELLVRVFEPFFTTKGADRGTGLGMSMVRRLVEQAGGEVQVDSAPGQGTEVRLCLPAPPDHAVARTSVEALEDTVPPEPEILLLEDQAAVRRVLVRALRRLGATVTAVGTGREALEAARRSSFDLLVTDGVVPGEVSAAEVLVAWGERPAIVVSGHIEAELMRTGIEAGRYPFVPKPFTLDQLRRAMVEAMQPADRDVASPASPA